MKTFKGQVTVVLTAVNTEVLEEREGGAHIQLDEPVDLRVQAHSGFVGPSDSPSDQAQHAMTLVAARRMLEMALSKVIEAIGTHERVRPSTDVIMPGGGLLGGAGGGEA